MIPASLVFAFVFGYFLTHLFRVVNATVGPAVAAEIGIDPAGLGFLTSVYFLAFAAVQLPLGILLDRFGAHRVQAALLVVAAAGATLFAVGGDVLTLTLGRAVIGIGVSSGLMAAFKAYSARLPAEKLPLANSLHMAAGSLGVLAAGLPVELAMQALGWRGLFFGLAFLSLVSAAVLVLAVRDVPAQAAPEPLRALVTGMGLVLAAPAFLRLAPIAVMVQATALALLALWVGPWLRDVAHYSPEWAATVLSLMGCSMIAGYALCAVLTNRLVAAGVRLDRVMIVGCLAFSATLPMIVLLPPSAAVPLWLVFALLMSFGPLSYPVLGAQFPPGLTGRVHTALNFVVFVAGFGLQAGFGVVVAFFTPRLGVETAYDAALWCLVGGQVAAYLWYALKRPLRSVALAR